MSEEICYLISDNGSYRPEATFSLRSLAERLGKKVGETIHPVSLLHSTKISSNKLNDIPAEVFESFVLKKLEEGVRRFHVTPMFFGPTAAILEYMPQRVEVMRATWPDLQVRISPCVVDLDDPGDERMAQILIDQIHASREKSRIHLSFHCTRGPRRTSYQGHRSAQPSRRASSPPSPRM